MIWREQWKIRCLERELAYSDFYTSHISEDACSVSYKKLRVLEGKRKVVTNTVNFTELI